MATAARVGRVKLRVKPKPDPGVPAVLARDTGARAVRLASAYDGAAKTRRTRWWKRPAGDANTITQAEAETLIGLARHLSRNNADAVSGISVLVNNVIGDGITPHVTPVGTVTKSKKRRAEVEDLLKAHCDTVAIDADGQTNLYGLQRAAFGAMVQDGEVLIRRRRRRMADGLPLPVQMQVLEADYLDRNRTETFTGGNRVIQGIEFDALGRRVAYWIFTEHPQGVVLPRRLESTRVAASEIIHLYRVDRPGQVRGIPWLSPAVPAFFELGDYLDAQLVRQKVAALYGAFVYTPADVAVAGTEDEQSETSSDLEPVETLEPGVQKLIPPGYDIKFGNPPDVGGLDVITPLHQRRIARTLGITYEALTGDYSRVNFSSGRMGWLEMARSVSATQETLMVPRFCLTVEAWLRDAIALQTMNTAPFGMTHAVPRREMIDPSKEVGALESMVRAGFMSKSAVVRSLGDDPDDVRAEQAADMEADAEAGLRFTTDAGVAAATAPADPNAGGEADAADSETTGDNANG